MKGTNPAPPRCPPSQLAFGVVQRRRQSRVALESHTGCPCTPRWGKLRHLPAASITPSSASTWGSSSASLAAQAGGDEFLIPAEAHIPALFALAISHPLFMPKASAAERSSLDGQQRLGSSLYLCEPLLRAC